MGVFADPPRPLLADEPLSLLAYGGESSISPDSIPYESSLAKLPPDGGMTVTVSNSEQGLDEKRCNTPIRSQITFIDEIISVTIPQVIIVSRSYFSFCEAIS